MATTKAKKAATGKTASPSSVKPAAKKAKKASVSVDVQDVTVVTDAVVAKTKVDIGTMSKQDIIEMFATKDGDTGSPEVQIALSSQKIANLADHLGGNPKDNHSRRGLLKIIAKRRRILHYLQDKDEPRYKDLIQKLGLKK